ncbi:hypothetical protein scyTo_0019443 [Scyliorhinus torazame]|uniref:Ataxin-2 C-terminal domain-containing protein n=1 Tax=Scyliorhinus torazame TaxID=75743 RepID=A0A401PZX7_SCYTO|nr:hypothetical protein [Scyliorhinus torazame]
MLKMNPCRCVLCYDVRPTLGLLCRVVLEAPVSHKLPLGLLLISPETTRLPTWSCLVTKTQRGEVAKMKDPSQSNNTPSINSDEVVLNGHSHDEDNPFAEYMWMENEEEFNRQLFFSLTHSFWTEARAQKIGITIPDQTPNSG